ncbi:MAG TPA: hypothetical protein VN721_11025, partial [Flavipsychrobacter sp.]|nr:hypothetical protein [Flavipsychrobacter sp.]
GWLLTHLAFLALIASLCYMVTMLHVAWLSQLAIFCVISLLCMFLFRFISIRSIKLLLNK